MTAFSRLHDWLDRRRPTVVLLVIITLFIYWRTPSLGFLTEWDDALYMIERPEVRHWFRASWTDRILTPALGYPVPIPTFLHYLIRQLPGEWVVPGAHLFNLGVHLLNVTLAYLLARRWLSAPLAATIAVCIWASHPLLVETVAWLTNLKGLLLGTFSFATLLFWDRYCREPTPLTAVATGTCLTAALGCRPEAVILLPICLGQLAIRRERPFTRGRHWLLIGPLSALVVAYTAFAVAGQSSVLANNNVAPVPSFDIGERLVRMGAALTLQVSHIFAPIELHPSYAADYPGLTRDAWIGLGVCVALLIATWVTVRRHPRCGFGWALWWGFYLPASGIVTLPRFTADTYMYLPLFGLLLAATEGATDLLAHRRLPLRWFAIGAGGLLVILLSVSSHLQTLRWRNTMTLWEPVHRERPDAVRPAWMVAGAYVDAGEYRQAVRMYDDIYDDMMDVGRIPLKMAVALEQLGRVRDALRVTVDLLQYEGKKHPRADYFFVRLISEHDVSLDRNSDIWDLAIRSAQHLLSDDRQTLDSEFCETALAYFQSRNADRLAVQFAACTVRHTPSNCSAWAVLDEHRETRTRIADTLPSQPADCRRMD